MLRGFLSAFSLAVAMGLAVPGSVRAADFMMGIVDTDKAIQSCKAGQQAKKGIDTLIEKKKQEFAPKDEELRKLEQEFETQKFVLASDALDERRIEIERRKSQLQRSFDEAREDIAIAQRKALQPILSQVEKLLKDIGKEKGLMMILEKGNPGVRYYSESLDITDILIERLNKS